LVDFVSSFFILLLFTGIVDKNMPKPRKAKSSSF